MKYIRVYFFVSFFLLPYLSSNDCITNYSGDSTCAAVIFSPTTEEEVQSAVRSAINEGVKVRSFGRLHSRIDRGCQLSHQYELHEQDS